MGEERNKNVADAKNMFEYFAQCVEEFVEAVSWDPQKGREERTRFVLASMSYWRLFDEEYVFFNPRHLESVVNHWKHWKNMLKEKNREELVSKKIREYEERLKHKKKLGEIGERFVDLSSSHLELPIRLSFVLEYEASPKWGKIIYDFRKLLSVLAPVKVGVFHLPKFYSTDSMWVSDKEGKITWVDKVLDSSKPDKLIEEMKFELVLNECENPNTVYLIILIHSQTEKNVNVYGYLLWREITGKVHSEKLLRAS